MVRARRAARRPGRIAVPIAAGVAVIAAAVAGWQLWPSNNTTSTTEVTTPSAAASSVDSSPTQSPSPTPSASPTSSKAAPSASKSSEAQKAQAQLPSCQEKVRAADEVRKAAEIGVGHWAEHVQAQTDADNNKITIAQMKAIWKRTRLAGPADLARYQQALDKYQRLDASCAKVSGAANDVAQKLSDCRERKDALQPVLNAGAKGMADWKKHQADMKASKAGQVIHPQAVWIATWRAAPPHINAFKRADRNFNAPSC